jgi:hypothetical protein
VYGVWVQGISLFSPSSLFFFFVGLQIDYHLKMRSFDVGEEIILLGN